MKNKRTHFLVVLFLCTLCACNKEDRNAEHPDHLNRTAIFTSSIGGENFTRASDTYWDAGDQIGVFMKKAGEELSSSSILNQAGNCRYMTENGTLFNAADPAEIIYYPDDGTAVDFIAYYPYQTTLSGFIYKIDISDQSSQEAIDLLYADNAKNQTYSAHSSSLVFSHQLSKIKLSIEAGEGISDLNNLEVTLSGVCTQADFELKNSHLTPTDTPDHTVALKITADESGKRTAEAVLLPDNGTNERVITFRLPSGKTFKHKIAVGTKLEKNTRYTFSVRLEDKGSVVEPQIGWVETPVMANLPTTQQYIIHMLPDREGRNFAMLYDTQYRLAYWVAYPLVPSYHTGNSGRTNAWDYDPKIAENYQPDLSSSFPASNTDRGHQLPSADRTYSRVANATTFYYSNMTAQQSQLNQGIWASLEEKIRTWADNCDTMYVVTGAMIRTATDQQVDYVYDNSSRQVARPKYFFKALAQRTGNSYTTIAFKMDNKQPTSGDSYNNHRVTVKELETETGFTFFPSLSEQVKSNIETSKWN